MFSTLVYKIDCLTLNNINSSGRNSNYVLLKMHEISFSNFMFLLIIKNLKNSNAIPIFYLGYQKSHDFQGL